MINVRATLTDAREQQFNLALKHFAIVAGVDDIDDEDSLMSVHNVTVGRSTALTTTLSLPLTVREQEEAQEEGVEGVVSSLTIAADEAGPPLPTPALPLVLPPEPLRFSLNPHCDCRMRLGGKRLSFE